MSHRPGPLSWDMGLMPEHPREPHGVPLLLDVTTRGIAVVSYGEVLGFVTADELRAVTDAAEKRCPTCGKYREAGDMIEAQVEEGWYQLGNALVEEGYAPPGPLDDHLESKLKRMLRRALTGKA